MNPLLIIVVLISVVAIDDAQSVKFLIVPSRDSPCPGEFTGETCLTLLQYSRLNNPLVSTTDVTLELQPGIHRFDGRISVSRINSFVLTGTDASLICTSSRSSQQFVFTFIANVQISGINLTNCLENQISSVTNFSMRDCSFKTSSLILQDVNATIVQSSFEKTPENSVLALRRTSMKLKNCHFSNNNRSAVVAGTNAQSNLTVESCTFTNNIKQGGHGGAIYFNGGSVIIRNSSFIRNSANIVSRFSQFSDGGAVHVNGTDYITVSDTTFTNNRAVTNGGAVSIRNIRGVANFTRCNFTDNFSTGTFRSNGGAVGLDGSIGRDTSISLTECNFTRNGVSARGGALYINTFTQRLPVHSVLINKCNFIENGRKHPEIEVTDTGGAIYIHFRYGISTPLPILVSECNFADNMAKMSGGAMYLHVPLSRILLTDSYFVNNILKNTSGNVEFGGAVYARSAGLLSIKGGAFINNTVIEGGGGVIYYITNTGTFRDRYMYNLSFVDVLFLNNSASYCGVLGVLVISHNSLRVNFTSSSFVSNRATGEVQGNIYQGSGAICIRNASMSFMNSTFRNNSAVGNAGVMQIEESTVEIIGSTFEHNRATLDGGVTYTKLSPNIFAIQESTFSGNSADDDGGVIYMGRAGSHVNVNESTFSLNSASDRGGVFVILGSTLDVAESSFIDNTANQGDVINACSSEINIDRLLEFHTNSNGTTGCTSYNNGPTLQSTTMATVSTTIAPQTESETSTASTIAQTDSASTMHITSQIEPESTTNIPEPEVSTTKMTEEESHTTVLLQTGPTMITTDNLEVNNTTTATQTNTGITIPTSISEPQTTTEDDFSPSTTTNELSTTNSLKGNSNGTGTKLGSVGLLLISCMFVLISTCSTQVPC